MNKVYNVVLLGCGQMGEAHIEHIYDNERVHVRYVCDYSIEKAEKFKKKYNADYAETDMEKCISDEKVDIVICATYPSSHLDVLKMCVKYNKHLLCEKPITNDLESGREFYELVKANPQIRVLVGHILRHNETYDRVAKMIEAGAIGKPIVMRMAQNHHTMNWPRYKELIKQTSPIVDCGVHYTDVMQWFTGEKITEVSGIGFRTEEDVPEGKYNYGLITVKLSGGSIGYYEAGWANTMSADNLKEFIGPKGRIRLLFSNARHNHQEEGDLIEYYKYPEKTYETINVLCERKPTDQELLYLINMIENNKTPKPTIDEVFECFKIVLEADRKIKEGLNLK